MGTKISALTTITGANTAAGDLLVITDVSDTTQGAGGTTKSITRDQLMAAGGPATFGATNVSTLAASGNVGIGGTPNTWSSPFTPIAQVGLGGAIFGRSDSANKVYLASNLYYNSGYKYIASSLAALYAQDTGIHTWYTAPTGTADAAATLLVAQMSLSAASGLAVTGAITATTTGKVGTTLGVGNATPAASGAGITFPATQSASTDPNTLDDYRKATATLTATGMTTSPTGVASFVKAGNEVVCYLPTIEGTSNATTFTLTGVPTPFRPSVYKICLMRITDNSAANTVGLAIMEDNGTITVSADLSGNAFTASGTKSIKQTSISYIL